MSLAVQLTAPYNVECATTSERSPAEGEVLVEIHGSSVSMAAELALFRGIDTPRRLPMTLGYESVGRVLEQGPGVTAPLRGARVVVTAGHCDRAVVRAAHAVAIPDDIPDEVAALLVLCCDVDTAIHRTGDTGPVLITGAGALGLLTLFVLRSRGLNHVDIVEPVPRRRAIALAYGARVAVDLSSTQALAPSYPTCFECADSPGAFELLVERTGHRGRIGVIADGFGGPLRLGRPFHDKELIVLGCSDEPRYTAFAPIFFDAVRMGDWRARLRNLYEDTIQLADLPAWYRAVAADAIERRPIKVWVHHDPVSSCA